MATATEYAFGDFGAKPPRAQVRVKRVKRVLVAASPRATGKAGQFGRLGKQPSRAIPGSTKVIRCQRKLMNFVCPLVPLSWLCGNFEWPGDLSPLSLLHAR